jgi:hypothetical protein
MLFMAVSPMMVYYSRYFIMEVPLVLFITLTIAALWRWSQGGSRWWLLLAGFALGMQHATKETFVINVVAGVVGLVVAKLLIGDFAPRQSGFSMGSARGRSTKPWLWVSLVAVFTSITIYSGFFKDWQAVKDSALTYLNYLERSGGSGHEKPWHYYLTLIFWRKDGVVWSEALIGGLAIIGMAHAFLGNHMKNASSGLPHRHRSRSLPPHRADQSCHSSLRRRLAQSLRLFAHLQQPAAPPATCA